MNGKERIYFYQNLSLDDLNGEIWKEVRGYKGYYMVSNLGRVKRLKTFTIYTDKLDRHFKRCLPEKIVRQYAEYR